MNKIRRTKLVKNRNPGPIKAAEYVRMSKEDQRYSIENQTAALRLYAAEHGMEVIRTYSDGGRSGLNLSGRKGLQTLLSDVLQQETDFSVVLVYDISRWGRFQDPDESAHYEYLCKKAGVPVVYCAESFEDDGSAMAAFSKSMRRTMAAETSRDLSVKVYFGKKRLIEKGFRQGGQAGFGLRRLLLDGQGKPKFFLRGGDRKCLLTDRVILVPGPREEVEVVWRIYDLYLYDGMTEREIANLLNADSPRPDGDQKWRKCTIHHILSNDKYAGDNVFGRVSCKLRAATRTTIPPEQWIINKANFLGLVSPRLFNLVQAERRRRVAPYSTTIMIKRLKELLYMKGDLTTKFINNEPGMPCARTYSVRFGGMREAYAAAGYCRWLTRNNVGIRHVARELRAEVIEQISRTFIETGASVAFNEKSHMLTINSELILSVNILRSWRTKTGAKRWVVRIREDALGDVAVIVRLDPGNITIMDYSIVPRAELPSVGVHLRDDSAALAKYRIEALGQLSLNYVYHSAKGSIPVSTTSGHCKVDPIKL